MYLRPRAEDRYFFKLEEEGVFLIVLAVYGICHTGDHRHATFLSRIRDQLTMLSLVCVSAWFFSSGAEDNVLGMLNAFVDKRSFRGENQFQNLTEAMLQRYEGNPN